MLSGGKDSRLIVGLTLATDSKAAFTFRTVGLDTQADVIVARLLARELDLDLEHILPVQVSLDAGALEERLRAHVFQTSGMFGAWDLQGNIATSPPCRRTACSGS
jgi:asparagine synthetase B (glutamine-hydrolysing)